MKVTRRKYISTIGRKYKSDKKEIYFDTRKKIHFVDCKDMNC